MLATVDGTRQDVLSHNLHPRAQPHWEDGEASAFDDFGNGLLDHLADPDDRVDNDVEGLALEDIPEMAPALTATELKLVHRMQANIMTAQAEQRRTWDPRSVAAFEQNLVSTVQAQEPTDLDAEKRRRVLAEVGDLVEAGLRNWTGMHVKPYGSFVSGLYTSTGDLDISVEGIQSDERAGEFIPVSELEKEEKIQLLKALGSKLTRNNLVRWHDGIGVERILHARVPIIKFRHAATDLDCDVSIASTGAHFKSTVLRYLCGIDWRFGALVRLVKLWAGCYGMNDATAGTFNSFALTLMVAFHLQTQSPPILPPICSLFRQGPDVLRARPLHAGRLAREGVLEACGETAAAIFQGFGAANKASLTELLASFFVLYHTCIQQWCRERTSGMRSVRISTWSGSWTYRHWAKKYCVGLEDPFDCTDNCARTIAAHASNNVAKAFGKAASSMLVIDSSTVDEEPSERLSLMQQLFTKPPAKLKGRSKGGGRGEGRQRQDPGPPRPIRVLPIPVQSMGRQPSGTASSQSQMEMQRPPGLGAINLSSSPILAHQPPPPPPRVYPQARNQQQSSVPSYSHGDSTSAHPSQPYIQIGNASHQHTCPQQPSFGAVEILPARQPQPRHQQQPPASHSPQGSFESLRPPLSDPRSSNRQQQLHHHPEGGRVAPHLGYAYEQHRPVTHRSGFLQRVVPQQAEPDRAAMTYTHSDRQQGASNAPGNRSWWPEHEQHGLQVGQGSSNGSQVMLTEHPRLPSDVPSDGQYQSRQSQAAYPRHAQYGFQSQRYDHNGAGHASSLQPHAVADDADNAPSLERRGSSGTVLAVPRPRYDRAEAQQPPAPEHTSGWHMAEDAAPSNGQALDTTDASGLGEDMVSHRQLSRKQEKARQYWKERGRRRGRGRGRGVQQTSECASVH